MLRWDHFAPGETNEHTEVLEEQEMWQRLLFFPGENSVFAIQTQVDIYKQKNGTARLLETRQVTLSVSLHIWKAWNRGER